MQIKKIKHKAKWMLIDFIEGLYSGLPICCVWSFTKGRRGLTLTDEEWNHPIQRKGCYVLCQNCVKRDHVVQIKHNGRLLTKIKLKLTRKSSDI